MEIGGYEVESISFSSIHVRLKPLTRLSKHVILRLCKENHWILRRWLDRLITSKHIDILKANEVKVINFKITIPYIEQGYGECFFFISV